MALQAHEQGGRETLGQAGNFHVNCPYSGRAQCYCPQGASLAIPGAENMTPVEQAAMAIKAKEMYEMWRQNGSRVQSALHRQAQDEQGMSPAEVLLPRLYRNPRSMDLGSDTPVRIRGTPITRTEALMRLEEVTADARNAVAKAAQLAAYAGIPFKPPQEFAVDPGTLQPAPDLQLLREVASGVVVEAARRGELSPEEEQVLLGLDPKGYRDLRAVQAAAQKQSKAMLEQSLRKPAAEEAPLRGAAGPAAGSTPEEPMARQPSGGMVLMRLEDVTRALIGRLVLIQQPGNDKRWHKAQVVDINPENGVAKVTFAGYPHLLSVDMVKSAQERRLAWADATQEGANKALLPQAQDSHNSEQSQMYAQQQQQQQDPNSQTLMQQYLHSQQGAAAAAAQGAAARDSAGLQRVGSGMGMPQQQQHPAVIHSPVGPMYGGGGYGPGASSPQAMQPPQQGSAAPRGHVVPGMGGRMMPGGMGMSPVGPEAPAVPQGQPLVARLIALGPKAYGARVEVMLLTTGQRRKGVVSVSYPSMGALGVVIGNAAVKLQAAEEFKTFTLRIVE